MPRWRGLILDSHLLDTVDGKVAGTVALGTGHLRPVLS